MVSRTTTFGRRATDRPQLSARARVSDAQPEAQAELPLPEPAARSGKTEQPDSRPASVIASQGLDPIQRGRPQAVAPPSVAAAFIARFPYCTFALSAVLGLRFWIEVRSATDWIRPLEPGHFSLLAMGASDRTQVIVHGEWWRLFTAIFLHASPTHLIGNLVTLMIVGLFLEPMIGAGWFAAIYLTGGFAGAMLSMLLNGPDVLSVGASGAIMAALAALFTLSFHANATFPTLMRRWSAGALVPALIPQIAHNGASVDTFAHLGGSVAGAFFALIIMAIWQSEAEERPPGMAFATLVAGFWAAMAMYAFADAGTSFTRYARAGLDYIPLAELPADIAAMRDNSFHFVQKYPHDPRSHVFRGLYFMEKNDASDAEPYFRNALAIDDKNPRLTPLYRDWVTTLLGMDLSAQGRAEEGRSVTAPLCNRADLESQTQSMLRDAKLCQ
jgi:rhomboid protease GluP